MNKTKIEWADYTLNHMVGCTNACLYCYAREINKRYGFIQRWDAPEIFPERLQKEYKIKIPKDRNRIAQLIEPNKPIVFIGSMTDLFCKGTENKYDENNQRAINFCRSNPGATFIFLTKLPEFYKFYEFPENCILGTTLDKCSNFRRLDELRENKKNIKFVSIEPILTPMHTMDFSEMEFLIIGSDTSRKAKLPEEAWIREINHPKIFLKDSIKRKFNFTI